MSQINPTIEPSWKRVLWDQFQAPYFAALKEFLIEEKKHYRVFPPGNCIFNAFDSTPFDQVKVVIIGQDPYHEIGQAHGLCDAPERKFAEMDQARRIAAERHAYCA